MSFYQSLQRLLSKKKTYDLIFGIGEACSCTQALRRARLQRASYPLDWVAGSNFLGRVRLLSARFDGFLDKNDLQDTGRNNGSDSHLCHIYYNTRTSIGFNHDFPEGQSLQESYPAVRQKYDRRIARLLDNIRAAETLLIVYVETPCCQDKTSDTDILLGYKILQENFPGKNLGLLYCASDLTLRPREFSQTQLSSAVTKITANYQDKIPGLPDNAVNNPFLAHLLAVRYRLYRPFHIRIQEACRNTAIRLIPFKKLRDAMRDKYHV